MAAPDAWNDQHIVIRIGNLLRAGVIASAVFLLMGGTVHLLNHGGERVALPDSPARRLLAVLHLYRDPPGPAVDRSTFQAMPAEFSQPTAIVRAALMGRDSDGGMISGGRGRGRALIQLGLLLLIATPVMRVAFSIFAFARQRDTLYVVFPMIVLGVLLYGLFSGQIH